VCSPRFFSSGLYNNIIVNMPKKKILFCILFIFLLNNNLYSQWPDKPSISIAVDDTLTGTAIDDSLTTDGNGGGIVVWSDDRNGDYDVYIQKVDSSGIIKWTSKGIQVSNLSGNASAINIIPDSAGGAIIAWVENDSIRMQRVDSLGNPKWIPGMNGISIDTVNPFKGLKMVRLDSLSTILYWIKGGLADTLFMQLVDSTGAKKWSPKDTVYAGSSNIINFTAIGDSGVSFVAWAILGDSIRINKVLETGEEVWGDSGVAVALTGTNMSGMSLVWDGADGAFLVWKNQDTDLEKVKAQRFNSAGSPQWGSPVELTSYASVECNLQAIPDGSDGIIVAWEDIRNGNSDIYAQRLSSGGVQQWNPGYDIPVCVSPITQDKVNIVSDGDGGAIIVWKDERTVKSGIYAQRIDNNGLILWDENGVAISDSGFTTDTDPNIISDGKGNAIISWTRNENAYVKKVWANGLLYPGNIVNVSMAKTMYGNPGDTIVTPMNVDNIFVSDNVLSCVFYLETDTSVIRVVGFDSIGTLAVGTTLNTNFSRIDSVYFSVNTLIPITGSGTLLKIKLLVNDSSKWGDIDTVKIDSFVYNSGVPAVRVSDGFYAGQFRVYGDVTGDDSAKAIDASQILKYVVGKTTFDSLTKIVADVSGNGKIFAYDGALVLLHDIGYLPQFPTGDTLFAWHLGFRRLAPITNSKAEIIANIVRTETDVIIPIELRNINNVLSSDIVLSYDNELIEFVGYNTTEISKDFQIMTNYKDGVLYVSMASVKGMTEDGKLIELRFRAKNENFDIQFVSFSLNEEEFEVSTGLETNMPKKFALHQNYPNPFNPETVIKFDLPKSSDVILKIYNVLGQEIRTLINERKPAGYHSVKWDSRNNNGVTVSSGIYLYRLKAGEFVITKKMILIK
jgi:hypothetical protein